MAGNPWFRMYTDFLRDPKMLSLAFEDQRHFIAILALKSEGTLDSGATGAMLDRMVAQFIWVDYSAIGEVKRRLIEADLIEQDWQPIAWNRRQFVSDHDPTGAERQRRYRQKRRDDERDALRNGDSNGEGDASVTLPEQNRTEQRQNRTEGRARKRATPIPAHFPITDSMRDWAKANASSVDVERETAKFIDWAQATGKSYKDHIAAWRNWIRKAGEFAAERTNGKPSGEPQNWT